LILLMARQQTTTLGKFGQQLGVHHVTPVCAPARSSNVAGQRPSAREVGWFGKTVTVYPTVAMR
jgi:hypothetical protein